MILEEISIEGQKKLLSARVLVIGAGGTGSPALLYLAGLGVGKIGIVDADIVDKSNLHRQIIHNETRIGMNKAVSARITLQALNPLIEYEIYQERMVPKNAEGVIQGFDIVIDATDNANSMYLISDACCRLRKPLVSGSAVKWHGQLSVFNYNGGPCYRCLFPVCPKPNMVDSCRSAGVIGIIPGIIGMLSALEALKIILEMKKKVISEHYLTFNGKNASFKKYKIISKRPGCQGCDRQGGNYIQNIAEYDYDKFTGANTCMLPVVEDEMNISFQTFLKQRNLRRSLVVDTRGLSRRKMIHLVGSKHVPVGEILLCKRKE